MDQREVIETWYRLYEKDVTHYLAYYTGYADVEDYVQETFLKAIREIERFRSASHPRTWLIAIARNVARDAFRRNKSYYSFLQKKKKETAQVEISVEQQLLVLEDHRALYRNILKLKDAYRDVLYLKGLLEMNSEECAEILDWSTNKVNVTYHRAVKKLKTLMEEEDNERGEVL